MWVTRPAALSGGASAGSQHPSARAGGGGSACASSLGTRASLKQDAAAASACSSPRSGDATESFKNLWSGKTELTPFLWRVAPAAFLRPWQRS